MEARELRIGNLVNHIRKGIIVVGIMELDFVEKGVLDIDPIPLTEEWLKKFGFEFEYKNCGVEAKISVQINEYWKTSFSIWSVDGWYYWQYTPGGYDAEYNDWPVELQYVHQLQNLFYCLCGKELTIKT